MRDSICNDCAKRTRCDMAEIGRSPLAISTCYGYEKGNPSNADRIRSMTDEELAIFLARAAPLLINQFAAVKRAMTTEDKAIRTWLEWLKQEIVKE